VEIKLYEPIGGFLGIDAKTFTDQIPADETEITVRINSPGGTVSDGLAIYNYLKDHKAHITTVVDGYAASSASVVMMAGDDRHAHKSSFVMVHNPWAMTVGNADDLRHQADVLDEHGSALLDIYKNVTGKDDSALREMMEDETWMRGDAAMENGFATHVIDETAETKAAAALAWSAMFDAIQQGKELDMSANPTKKEVTAQRDELQAEVDELRQKVVGVDEAIESAKSEVRTEVQAEVDAAHAKLGETESDLAAVRAAVDTLTEENTAADAIIGEKVAQINDQAATIETQQSAIDESNGKISALENKLKDPAYQDANLQTVEIDAQAATDAEADELESVAKDSGDEADDGSAWEVYHGMQSGAERLAYWRANRKAIIDSEPTE